MTGLGHSLAWEGVEGGERRISKAKENNGAAELRRIEVF